MGLFKDATGVDERYIDAPLTDELNRAMYAAAVCYRLSYIDLLIKDICQNPDSDLFLKSLGVSTSRFCEEGYIDSILKKLYGDQQYARDKGDSQLFSNITKCFATFSIYAIDYILGKYPSYRGEYFDKMAPAIEFAARSDFGITDN